MFKDLCRYSSLNNFRRKLNEVLKDRLFSSSSVPIRIVEVGPRDGLQNEKSKISTETKVELINKLSNAGLETIEVSSFVHPKWVPQLADAEEVFESIKRVTNTKYLALIPNKNGMQRAVNSNVDGIAILTSASETFSKRNSNCSVQESLLRCDEVLQIAKHHKLYVRGYISCALGCPYEDQVSPDTVAKLTEILWKLGCHEICLGDTIGRGTPDSMDKLLSVILKQVGACPIDAIAIHCHDTGGRALGNIEVALNEYNVRTIDSSIGGLGGCPYAGPGAPGNVATEKVVSYFYNKGFRFTTDLNVVELDKIGKWIRQKINKSGCEKTETSVNHL